MEPDFSKAALTRFLNTVVDQGLVNANTARGWSAASSRIFEDVADSDDVRTIDVQTAIKRYHNKHPGDLKGTVLKEYERRLTRALADFQQYVADPTSYKGRGRGPSSADIDGARPTRRSKNSPITPPTASIAVEGASPRLTAVAALSLDFPMRPDFLAQIVVPRDMKADEARRLSRFIMTLALDYEPKAGDQ